MRRFLLPVTVSTAACMAFMVAPAALAGSSRGPAVPGVAAVRLEPVLPGGRIAAASPALPVSSRLGLPEGLRALIDGSLTTVT